MQGEAECESDFELRKPMAEGFVPCIWNGQVTRGREVDGKWINFAVSSCLSLFLSASTAATYIFTAPTCTVTIISSNLVR